MGWLTACTWIAWPISTLEVQHVTWLGLMNLAGVYQSEAAIHLHSRQHCCVSHSLLQRITDIAWDSLMVMHATLTAFAALL